ncbi:MAG: phage protease, partial [Gammaproteobacteria bacterium]|nr:phage protease [Gammaproteobacteria bacterium]
YGGTVYPKVVTGVALLGAEMPAVKEAGLEEAVVYTEAAPADHVIEYSLEGVEVNYEQIEPSLDAIGEAIEKIMKGKPGVRILRALWGEVRHKVRGMFEKKLSDEEIEAELSFSKNREEESMKKELLTELGLDEKATDEQAMEAVKTLKASTIPVAVFELLSLAAGATGEQVVAAIRGLAEGATAKFADIEVKLQKAETDLKAERRTGRLAYYKEQVAELKAIEGKPEELAEELVSLEEVKPEAATKMLKGYQNTNAKLVAAGIFTHQGTPAQGGDSGEHEFVKKMKAYMAEKHVDEAAAQAELRKTEPVLFKSYMAERRKAEKKEAGK